MSVDKSVNYKKCYGWNGMVIKSLEFRMNLMPVLRIHSVNNLVSEFLADTSIVQKHNSESTIRVQYPSKTSPNLLHVVYICKWLSNFAKILQIENLGTKFHSRLTHAKCSKFNNSFEFIIFSN